MALGALFSWAWIPEVQDERGSDLGRRRGRRARKGLEEMGMGRRLDQEGVREKDSIGFRKKGGG